MFIRNILLLMVLISGQTYTQNVTYSKTGNEKIYTVAAPDKSIEFVFSSINGHVSDFYINGSWNRISNNIVMQDRSNQLAVLDFAIGTYTELITNNNRPIYDVSQKDSNTIKLSANAMVGKQNVNIKRNIVLLDNGIIKEQLILSNISRTDLKLDFEGIAFSFASLFDISRATTNNSNIPEYQFFDGKKLQKVNINGGSWFGGPKPSEFLTEVKWATISDNFFLAIVEPKFDNTVVVYNGLQFGAKSRISMGIQVLATNIAPNQSLTYDLDYYVGPRHEQIVAAQYKKLFAWPIAFNWLLKPIENGTIWMMSTLVFKTGSAGLTLILIAILVKLLLLPLSIKSALSMKKMKDLQPKLNKLQEKWGHDPQALQVKTMELYKSEKANPLGGCLPLLLQIPVFFALFRVLSRSVELRGAGFMWISDLTMPDSLFTIGTFSFNLLPLIMTVLQLVTVVRQQSRMGNTQNEMQKQMQTQSYFMPLIFLFLFWNMPSGLVLYWTVQNIFSIFEQEFVNLDSNSKN